VGYTHNQRVPEQALFLDLPPSVHVQITSHDEAGVASMGGAGLPLPSLSRFGTIAICENYAMGGRVSSAPSVVHRRRRQLGALRNRRS
jgi:hypothetical protein